MAKLKYTRLKPINELGECVTVSSMAGDDYAEIFKKVVRTIRANDIEYAAARRAAQNIVLL